jgi:hypothetical protein
MKRLIIFDVLRGIFLLMMVVDHSPSRLRLLTDQPMGFFTTAEGFVFVSAFLAGMLFRRRTEQSGFAAARSGTIHRAWRIYCGHLLTLAFAFAVGGWFLPEFPGIGNLLDQYLRNPWAAITGSVVLMFRPPLMDILPIYILFSLLTPFAFWAAQRWGWKTVITTSLLVWFISQTRVSDCLLTSLKGLPYVELGPFDILAWQLLWIVGLFFGQRFYGSEPAFRLPKPLQHVVLALALGFLGWRWTSIYLGFDLSNQTWLLDKWHLGPLRLMNFFVVGWLVSKFLKSLERWATPLRPLSLIGQHMLPVFCCQICLSILLIGMVEPLKQREPIASVLVIGQLLSALLLGWLFERISRRKISTAVPSRVLATHRKVLTANNRLSDIAAIP